MSNEERRAAKTQVLSKVNQVLATAGLNDTVWSVRDCDSTLFVLMYKKIVGVGKLQGVATQPTSTEEHARNFSIHLVPFRGRMSAVAAGVRCASTKHAFA